jgi:diguanylate cyclase (GGDEF)-like protein
LKRPRSPANPELGDLDLKVALQLLRQAGYADPLDPAGQSAGGKQATSTQERLQTIIDRLCEISQRDALTGLANARHFRAALEQEVDRVSRSGEIALLLLVDLDYLKAINDKYGHLAGDQALRTVAQVLAKNVRPMDTAARYGGDEFAVILPNCRPGAGLVIAERIREQVEQNPIGMPDGTTLRLTTSIGGAHVSPWRKIVAEEVLEKADQALYRAKAQGRNQVSMDTLVATPVSFDEKLQLLDRFGQDADE